MWNCWISAWQSGTVVSNLGLTSYHGYRRLAPLISNLCLILVCFFVGAAQALDLRLQPQAKTGEGAGPLHGVTQKFAIWTPASTNFWHFWWGKWWAFFWTTPCRNIIIIFCRGWPGTFQPPQKNTRTAVGLFSKNQSYLEMIHPPINWHSYGNPWVSSWKMLQMMFLFGIFGADRSGPSHISSRQGQMP